MKRGVEESIKEISKQIKKINEGLNKITPYILKKTAKKFNKSSHIILPADFKDKEVLVIKFPLEKK